MAVTVGHWIRKTIRHKYFPEVWYFIENWFMNLNGGNILEVGCGKGLFTEALAKSQWNVSAVDPSEASLRTTEARLKHSGLKITLRKSVPEKLPFPDATFDAITCIHMLEFSERPDLVLKEIARILKPGGKAVVATFQPGTMWGMKSVASSLRSSSPNESVKYRAIDHKRLKMAVKASGLEVHGLKARAKYLPFMIGGFVLPWLFAGSALTRLQKTG